MARFKMAMLDNAIEGSKELEVEDVQVGTEPGARYCFIL